MSSLKVFVLGLVILVSSSFAKSASRESVLELMNVTGAGQLGVQVMQNMLPQLKQMLPNSPQKFWDDLEGSFNPDELVDLVIPIYQKHFTESDIKAIIKFYKTDIGVKFIKAQPAIVNESSLAGQQWGQKIAQDILIKYNEQTKQ